MDSEGNGTIVRVTQVHHDLANKRSLVVLVWPDQQDRQLRLPIPFGTELERVHEEAEKALRVHGVSIRQTTVARE